MKKKLRSICFFLPTGKTFTFRNVEILTDNETVIVFRYLAMSDNLRKIGTFLKANIAGDSRTQ